MVYKTNRVDDNNNLVEATIFESYLAKFILDHPEFYKETYLKLFQGIIDNIDQIEELSERDKKYAAPMISSAVSKQYEDYKSIEAIKDNFFLPVVDYAIKFIAGACSPTVSQQDSPRFFQSQPDAPRDYSNSDRNKQLFSAENRGVKNRYADGSCEYECGECADCCEEEQEAVEIVEEKHRPEEVNRHLGIVAEKYRPNEFELYFKNENTPAGQYYIPDEDSYVAQWLRQYHCPVISGASGTTESIISRLFKYVELTEDEKKLIIFAQACSMVALGHHSLFEAFIVAEDFKLISISKQDTQMEFYLQCMPLSIRNNQKFFDFIQSDKICDLFDIQVPDNQEELEQERDGLRL